MHRFYDPRKLEVGQAVELQPEAARQCFRVLRLHQGEQVALFDGAGSEAVLSLEEVSAASAAGTIERVARPDVEPMLEIDLLAALPRADKWEWILQKGTELGVRRFSPLETARCVVRVSASDWPQKQRRWEKILVEAAEQSGRTRIPELSPPLTLRQVLSRGAEGIVLHTGTGLPGLGDALRSAGPLVHGSRASAAASAEGEAPPEPPGNRDPETAALAPNSALRLLLGPEGGLEEGEFRSLVEAGWTGASLGPRTLRCETAALVACTLALDVAGEMGSGSKLDTFQR